MQYLPNKLYDSLVFVAQILLPACGALYFGLADLWTLPNSEEVVGTIVIIDAFLGAILGLNKVSYDSSEAKYDGTLNITADEMDGSRVFSLDLKDDPDHLVARKEELVFKVNQK